ncbi:MAG: M20 family metallo-hydrolase [Eubacteriales bacterium]|nr:M20 family metallo-hydrolase [Clostridiales bacterium]MDY5837011.1 M20 family metallo-hydrolase [Eubacteriales bacterium]
MKQLELTRQRLMRDLNDMKVFTTTPGKGCTRLPFTCAAQDCSNALKRLMIQAGMEVCTDVAGNVFGRLPGHNRKLPCVMMGSHYDSVLHGGDYDGIAGILCAIEVARLLQENGEQLERDFVVAAFNDEEGMRFGTGYFGSGAMLGLRDVDYCHKYKDIDGISIYDAMRAVDLDPEHIDDARWPDRSISCFLELHIEQGPVLDRENVDLGLVDCIAGIKRYVIKVKGRADHAGTTPMDMRLDAVDAASKVISNIADWARESGEESVATVGLIKALPGGINIIAEECEFTVDIRSRKQEILDNISSKIIEAVKKETNIMGGQYEIEEKLDAHPVYLCKSLLDSMEVSCRNYGYSFKYMSSGAGHDALVIAPCIPTVMLFVPSVNGRSHCPVEFTDVEYFVKAVQIMRDLATSKLSERD